MWGAASQGTSVQVAEGAGPPGSIPASVGLDSLVLGPSLSQCLACILSNKAWREFVCSLMHSASSLQSPTPAAVSKHAGTTGPGSNCHFIEDLLCGWPCPIPAHSISDEECGLPRSHSWEGLSLWDRAILRPGSPPQAALPLPSALLWTGRGWWEGALPRAAGPGNLG